MTAKGSGATGQAEERQWEVKERQQEVKAKAVERQKMVGPHGSRKRVFGPPGKAKRCVASDRVRQGRQ